MGKYRRLGKNTLLVFAGNAGSKLIGLLMLPFYTRWLSPADYGTTDIVTVYVTVLSYLVTCCISEAIFVFPKGVEKKEQKEYFSSGIAFILIMFCLTGSIFIAINYFTINCHWNNGFVNNLWLIYFMLISTSLQQYTQQFVRSIDKMVVYSTTGIINTVATIIFAVLFIPLYHVKGYIWSIIIANLLGTVYSFLTSKSDKYISINSISTATCKKMLHYTIPLIPNGIMWWIVAALNRPMMEKYLGFHDIGIYAVANKFPGILSMLFTLFGTAWQISVLEEFYKPGYKTFFNNMMRFLFSIMCIALLILALCSKLLISIFAAPEFFEAWRYVPFLVLGVLFSNIAGFAGSHFLATKESKYYFYSSVWGALVAIASNILLIPTIGILGSVLSTLTSFFVMAIFRIYYGWKYVKITHISNYLLMFGGCTIVCTLSYLNMALPSYIFSCITAIYIFFTIKNDIVYLKNIISTKQKY